MVDINAAQEYLNKRGLLVTKITANPSEEFIRNELEGTFNDPEVTDIRMTVHNRWSQGMRDNAPEGRTGETSETEDIVESIKEQANAQFKSGEYMKAVEAYTKALGFSSTPAETRRTLLSNRAQSHILLGDLDMALNDTTLALSDALTTLESPKSITLKLHYRQAKIFFLTHQYDKASQAFKRFEGLKQGLLTAAEKKLKKDIAGASGGKS